MLSIVTPSYNQRQFIKETVDSILSQRYVEWELHIIDGGSSDGTVDYLKTLDDPRIRWVSEPDEGQTNAINKGFRKCTGEIVCWMNSDDTFCPNALNRVAHEFKKDPKLDILSGDKFHIDEAGEIISVQRYSRYDVNSFANDKMAMCNQACFWKRELFDKIGYLDESIQFVMDLEYFVRMGVKGKDLRFKHIPVILGSQRYYQGTKTSDEQWKKVWNKEQIEVLAKNGLSSNLASKLAIKWKRARYHLETGYWHYLFTNKV